MIRKRFIKRFLKKQAELSYKRRADLEKSRTNDVSRDKMAWIVAITKDVFEKYNIISPEQVFNFDESEISTITAARDRVKELTQENGRCHSTELKWS